MTGCGPPGPDPAVHDRRNERGYVAALTALVMIPLLIFAAFATDVGSWYVEGQRVQRAVDAGALAGVVWIPNEAKAAQVALETIQYNGYPTATLVTSGADFDAAPASGPPVVFVESIGPQEIRVRLKAAGDVYLGGLAGVDDVSIPRRGTAQYIKPLAMGNPTSTLGNGVDSPDPDHFWLNILPESYNRNSGDLVSSTHGATGGVNPNYEDRGYLYVIDVPTAASGNNWYLQIRSSCYTQNQGKADYTLYAPDSTPFTDYDNVTPANLVKTETFGREINTGACGWTAAGDDAQWHTFHDVGVQAGRWVFQAKHAGGSGRVLYSMRVVDTSGNPCTSATNPSCPLLSALNWMGAFTQSDMFGSGSPSSFTDSELYLAEVGPEYAGNTLEILLFDPADGIDAVKVKDPFGNFASFTWDTIDVDRFGYDGGGWYTTDAGPFNQVCNGDSAVTSPAGGACNPTQSQRNWFQDRTVRIHVPISTTPCNGTDCWWKLVYINDANDSNETTTWRATVIGDPVRLTE